MMGAAFSSEPCLPSILSTSAFSATPRTPNAAFQTSLTALLRSARHVGRRLVRARRRVSLRVVAATSFAAAFSAARRADLQLRDRRRVGSRCARAGGQHVVPCARAAQVRLAPVARRHFFAGGWPAMTLAPGLVFGCNLLSRRLAVGRRRGSMASPAPRPGAGPLHGMRGGHTRFFGRSCRLFITPAGDTRGPRRCSSTAAAVGHSGELDHGRAHRKRDQWVDRPFAGPNLYEQPGARVRLSRPARHYVGRGQAHARRRYYSKLAPLLRRSACAPYNLAKASVCVARW